MSSRLVVLGSCGAWPEPGRACSGYLLDHAGFRVVLDLGYGTASRLFQAVDSIAGDGIDAVVITHEHPDHMVDLHALFRARWFGARGAQRIPLFAPPGVRSRLRDLQDDDEDRSVIDEVFAWHELPGNRPYPLGPWVLSSRLLPHFVPNAGVRLTAAGLSVAYTGDTGPEPRLVELARDVDLLIAEASDRNQRADTPLTSSGILLHLSARDAGQLAQAAGAKRLLLSHFWPGNDREATEREARRAFRGEVVLATEGLCLSLP